MRLSTPLAAAIVCGCSSAPSENAPPPEPAAAKEEEPPEPPADAPLIVAFGDSLTEGYGLRRDESYPAVLERELRRRGLEFRVVNEGVSGDTTATALVRVDSAAARRPAYVVVSLGGNDGLRGLGPDQMEANLRRIIERFQSVGAKVVLAGMRMPPNFGPDYTQAFENVYPRLAKETGAELLPFLLEGVAGDRRLNQDDGIHPTAEGAAIIARTVADFLEPILRRDAE